MSWRFLSVLLTTVALWPSGSPGSVDGAEKQNRLNVMLFTADDLNCDSLGCYGSKVPDISPNLDRFATQSMRFSRAHVTFVKFVG